MSQKPTFSTDINTQTGILTGTLNSALTSTGTVAMSSRLKRKLLRVMTGTRPASISSIDPYLSKTSSPEGVFSETTLSVPETNSAPSQADTPIEIGGLYSVNQPRVNIRIAPSLDAKILGYLTRREVIKALSEKNGWVEFQLGTLTGWVKKSLLTLVTK